MTTHPALPPERFSLSQFTTRQPFLYDLELCCELRIPALELCESKLGEDPAAARAQLRQLRDSGLRVSSVQARVHAVFPDQMAPEPADPAARADAFIRTMDLVTEALPDEHPVYVLISGRAPDHDLGRGREALLATAARLAREAAARGAGLAFEPLHPVMMNEDSFVWSWEDAMALVRAVDHPALGVVCDLWNVWDQPGILARVRGDLERVRLVHASDWRDGGPHRLNDRLVPGRGVIPFDAWGEVLREGGYAGWTCLEMLSDESLDDSYLREPIARVVDEGRVRLRAAGCIPSGAPATPSS